MDRCLKKTGSFHKCTYTQVSKPPNPSVVPVISSTNAHSARSLSLCGYAASSGLCWCCRVSSDNLQMLHSLNNSHSTCFQPDVKQKPFSESDARSKMQIVQVSICWRLSRSDWLQLSLLNGRSWSGQIFYSFWFNKLVSIVVFSKKMSFYVCPFTFSLVIWLHKHWFLILCRKLIMVSWISLRNMTACINVFTFSSSSCWEKQAFQLLFAALTASSPIQAFRVTNWRLLNRNQTLESHSNYSN